MQKITVGEVVSDALKRCADGNWIGALRDISGLVEGTAKAESRTGGKTSFKERVDANTRLIVTVATHGTLSVQAFRIGTCTRTSKPLTALPLCPT